MRQRTTGRRENEESGTTARWPQRAHRDTEGGPLGTGFGDSERDRPTSLPFCQSLGAEGAAEKQHRRVAYKRRNRSALRSATSASLVRECTSQVSRFCVSAPPPIPWPVR